MDNLFNSLANILKPENPETLPLKIELNEVLKKIEPLERAQNSGYTSDLANAFPFGMVGGSGKNVHRLNKRKENELNKTIDRAVILCDLYKKRDYLKQCIEYIESGKRDEDEKKKQDKNFMLSEYWKGLKAGDFINIGNNKVKIIKKNTKSIETESGCKWNASEIIGKKAADLL